MRLLELFEQEAKHVTFCFGRMNPPTVGHAEVFKTMAAQGGEFEIFVSQSQDSKDNPLSYEEKIKFIRAIHPQYADNVVENRKLNTVVKVASYLYEQGYRNATFVAGSDRLDSFKKLLAMYNGVEGKAHGYYKFDLLDFVSSGARDPDSEGVSGVSASKARAAAAVNNFEAFAAATGAGETAREMFDAVRKGMGMSESINYAVENKTMKAKEFIPAGKPRNFVAKNAQSSGAGIHQDSNKKKDQEQGRVKHKRDLTSMEGFTEATGDKPFDAMMKQVTKAPTAKARNAERIRQKREREAETKAHFANGGAFGASPADKLSIRKAKGVSETSALEKFRIAAAAREKKHDAAEKEMQARHARGKEDMKGSIDRLQKQVNKK